MANNNFVEFELSGGYFKTSHLRDKNGRKLFVDAEAAKKAGLPENTDRIVRWLDGTPVGSIELSEKGKRVFRVSSDETAIINGLAFHEFVSSPFSKSVAPKLIMRDLSKVNDERDNKREKRKIVDTVFVNLNEDEIADLAAVLGYSLADADEKIFQLKDKNPDTFLSYFKEPFKKGNFYTAKLKEETQISAVLKRAILAKVVTTKAGSISFEDEMIGTDFNSAVNNLMDTTKQGKNNILSLIKAKLAQ
jgi:hypothetical protein